MTIASNVLRRAFRAATSLQSFMLDELGAAKVDAKKMAAAFDRLVNRSALDQRERRRRTFQSIYNRGVWGKDETTRFFSGVGSNPAAAEFYVGQMAALLERHAKELGRPLTIVDLGCGDFRIGKALVERLPALTYIGCDIVPELIAYNAARYTSARVRFQTLDAVCDPLPEGDVCLVRQVFQHLTNNDILSVLTHMPYPCAYVSEGQPVRRIGPVNPDKVVGASVRFDWRTGRGRGVELNQPPFDLPSQEVFRFSLPPNEVIITERLDLTSGALAKGLANKASAVSR
jgi:SAM-dependent methyltransferase